MPSGSHEEAVGRNFTAVVVLALLEVPALVVLSPLVVWSAWFVLLAVPRSPCTVVVEFVAATEQMPL